MPTRAARTNCADKLGANGLDPCIAQGCTSFDARAGTLPGLHSLRGPYYPEHPRQGLALP
ncbi:MAG TPA: hypothetical protein VFH48_00230 [Chloroflexota bacterium]|nr:hypothetical protein [Chloroflexota bacterium]